jgi:hypothetical protein
MEIGSAFITKPSIDLFQYYKHKFCELNDHDW